MLDAQDLIGRSVGPYTVSRLLGQGGFAWVFEAERPDDLPVALKILKPRYGSDPQFDRRFRKEAQVAAELTHPHIVQILDVGHADGLTYFTMPLAQESLDTLIERHGAVPEIMVMGIAVDIAAGLAFAHEAGVVHRDIKPANILLLEGGRAVIGDFGIARAVSGYVSATGVNMTIGTPQYISPEQAQGRPLDGRSDLYALGVLLYKSVTGDVPFRSTDWFELARMHVEQQPEAPRKKQPNISARFERVILRCLAKHPDDRYPSAKALCEELELLASEDRTTETFGRAPASSAEYAASLGPEDRKPRWPLLLLALLLVIVVAVAVVLVGR
jgi:serine/threonine-protein kinase